MIFNRAPTQPCFPAADPSDRPKGPSNDQSLDGEAGWFPEAAALEVSFKEGRARSRR